MRYDLANPLHLAAAQERLRHLAGRGAVVDITEKRSRALPQNSYLHLLFALFALSVGETAEYVKRNYYKLRCNHDIFLREKDDPLLGGKAHLLRSVSELTREELSLSIDRFRDWASREAGIYLPDAGETEALRQAEVEVSRAQRWL